jgi:putative tricarboxylic transport membrane protein
MRLDHALGAGAVLVAAPVALTAWSWGIGSLRAPGPGFWPLMIAVAVAGLGAALLLHPGPTAGPAGASPRWRQFGIALATLAFYVAALEPLGYLVATSLLLLVQMRWVEGRGWRASVLTALIAAAVSFVLFRQLLGVPLPVGSVFRLGR